ncbi:MAG: glycosyltransferase [Terriglobia bacterium]
MDSNSAQSPVASLVTLKDYGSVVGEAEIAELRALAGRLRGKSVKMVNSTAVGGGVAEILNRMVPLLLELEIPTRWDVVTGGNDFFEVTKAFHNALHGAPYEPRPENFKLFLTVNEMNRARMDFSESITVIHDPQPVALVRQRKEQKRKEAWIWRCHIDLSHANPDVWAFLEPWVKRYDAALFSSPNYSRHLPIPQYLFYPAIDPVSEKNRELEPDYIQSVLERYAIDPRRPILTQVSRFDRLKDPLGVLQAYRLVKKYMDCQLVLVGGGAPDDPEGGEVLAEVREAVQQDPDVHILELPPWSALEINALQQASTIVIQKSLREGFALTVAEALWKKRPVVASAVGGIPTQVLHKHTGMLVHSVEGCAYQIRYLLANPAVAARLGENGREHVRANFLITSTLKRYLVLFLILSGRL